MVAVSVVRAESLSLPGVFADGMVLQRQSPVRFRGHAEPGRRVSVTIDGVQVATAAGPDGGWTLLHPPRAAGGPYTMTVEAGKTIEFENVMFGDVWLAGGQSNMEWKIDWGIDRQQAEIDDSDYPAIRYLEVPNTIAPSPRDDIPEARWVEAGPQSTGGFSAVAWFFAKHNHLEKNVPVGVIDSTWGGTPAEGWLDARRLRAVDGYKDQAREALDPSANWKEKIADNNARDELKQQLIHDRERVLKLDAYKPGYDDSGWASVELPNREPLSDFAWLRKTVELSEPPGEAELRLGELVQEAFVFINGELVASEDWQDTTSVHSLPAGVLTEGENLIALRIANSWNNEVYAGKPGRMALETERETLDLEGRWRYSNRVEQPMPAVERYNWMPGFLYNAMIHPVAGYTVRGVIWYQGESNTDRPRVYEHLFKTLIDNWRVEWRQGALPFLFVQLANFSDDNPEADWALLRESQAAALEMPQTGMAVTIDIGNPDDVHPRNKQDVGKRLWLAARNTVFNDEDLVWSGPVYRDHARSDGKIAVTFEHVAGGLVAAADGAVKGFEIAGADRRFHPANARIEGQHIVVSSPEVAEPVAVRYGWSDNPQVNLYNAAGLPAAPFRTDNW